MKNVNIGLFFDEGLFVLSVLGDPNDRSLRRVEADVSIPERMNERIQRVECREPLEGIFSPLWLLGHCGQGEIDHTFSSSILLRTN